MQIQSIGQYEAVVSVSVDDCRILAEACELAAAGMCEAKRQGDVAYVEALGAAFKALATAALALWAVDPATCEELMDSM